MTSLKLMKTIYQKLNSGFNITNTPEYASLLELCASEEQKERISACKCIFYLWDWKLIDNKTFLAIFSSVSAKTKEINDILDTLFCVVSSLCEKEDELFLKSELPLFLITLSSTMKTNDLAVFAILSRFEIMEFKYLYNNFKPLVYDLMLGDYNNRALIWSMLFPNLCTEFQKNLLLHLKYHDIEDNLILLMCLKSMDLNKEERSLFFSVLNFNMLNNGQNPVEALSLLRACVLNASPFTQSLVFLTLLSGLDAYSHKYLLEVFKFFEWFLQNIKTWTEALWIALVSLIPFSQPSVIFPSFQKSSLKLIRLIEDKIAKKKYVELKGTEVFSVSYKYIIYRHDCLHQSLLILRLLSGLKNDDSLIKWLKEVTVFSQDWMNSIMTVLIGKYLLTRSTSIQKVCLSLLENFNQCGVHTNLYWFKLLTVCEPDIINNMLNNICQKHAKEENFVIPSILTSLPPINKKSFNVSISLMSEASKNGYQLGDNLLKLLRQDGDILDVTMQAQLVKTLALDSNIYFEEIIEFCNRNLETNVSSIHGFVSISLLIDIIRIMCQKQVIDVTLIWENSLKTFIKYEHPLVYKSLCEFLSEIPTVLKHRHDENLVQYKSARVLWHFAYELSYSNSFWINQELALRCLKNYDLDIFDATFLSKECKTHHSSSSFADYDPIQGLCWAHILKNELFADLFISFINKVKTRAKFRETYASLFEGLISYLSLQPMECEEKTQYCLKVLMAEWIRIPENKDLKCLEYYISFTATKLPVLFVILRFSSMNQSASVILEKIIAKNDLTEYEKATFCLLPGNLLEKHREVNESILRDGLVYAMMNDEETSVTGGPLCLAVENSIKTYCLDHTTPCSHWRIIMKALVQIWVKFPWNHQVVKQVSSILAVIYGFPLLRPLFSISTEIDIEKYILLSRDVALTSKQMRFFDINVGIQFESAQESVIENLIYVLQRIAHEHRNKNLKWILRVLGVCAMKTSNFLCKVIIYAMNYISGVHLFIEKDSLENHLNCFPLSVGKISRMTKKGPSIASTLNEISRKTSILHPIFIEVIRFGILRILDEPSISYESVARKCIM